MGGKRTRWLAGLLLLLFFLAGCGNTLRGLSSDTVRIAKGLHTVIFTDQ